MSAASTSGARTRFLDLPALAALQHMRFTTKHRIEGTFSGRHRSRSQSGSGEFVDYREYSPGEDLRRLDWKVLARTERTYIRLYQDETNLVCTLLLDASESMRFGEQSARRPQMSKLEYAQYLSTAFSQVISRQQDQVGLAVMEDGLKEHVLPGATPGHVRRVQEIIANINTAKVSKLATALNDLFPRLRHRGVLVLMSDFLVDDLEAVFSALRLFRHRRFEVVLLHLIHPDEEQLPDGMAFRFEGMEADGNCDCSPAEIRETYRELFESFAGTVRNLALSTGCDYRRISTATPYLQTLGSFLVERTG